MVVVILAAPALKYCRMIARPATLEDVEAIARIYNQAIDDRTSTFETRQRAPDEVAAWLDGIHPVIVVEWAGQIVAYAVTSSYSQRACYRGVAEFAVYVDRDHRTRGAGRLALESLFEAAREAGFWKLVSRIFPENAAVRRLNEAVGVREIGVHRKHACLDGVWRDVIVVERLLDD
jgi:phosphinothricin acetyltransferase